MGVTPPVYLDFNATTPVDERVFEAMKPYFTQVFGNAASASHGYGADAKSAVDQARERAAALLGAQPDEIIWTAGATESNNLAIKGVAEAYADKGRHIITQTTEHKSVIDACKRLERAGFQITWLTPDSSGWIDPVQVRSAIRNDTILVSIMGANNETGTIQPLGAIGRICRERGVLLHSDATQAVGKSPLNVENNCIDLLAFTGHKLYGPKGCGGLYVRLRGEAVHLSPLLDGGGHERGFRSGTLNVPGIVGVGMACEIGRREMAQHNVRLRVLRDRLESGIRAQLPGVRINGAGAERLAHVANLSFEGVDGVQLLPRLNRQVACSSGSACSSANPEPSYVLKAMGLDRDLALASVRFSLGRITSEAEVEFTINSVVELVSELRRPAVRAGDRATVAATLAQPA